jgi:hypothetical protein
MGKVWSLKDAGLMVNAVKKDVHKAAVEGMQAAGYRVVQKIVGEIIPSLPRPPVDRGAYRAGWRVRKTPNGCVVENVAPHAAFIEFGVRAGQVKIGRAMIESLAAWVRRKGIGGKTVTGGSGKVRHVRATESEARSIAWAIAKSMQKKGIFAPHGLRVLEKATRSIPQFMREEIGTRLAKV